MSGADTVLARLCRRLPPGTLRHVLASLEEAERAAERGACVRRRLVIELEMDARGRVERAIVPWVLGWSDEETP